MDILWSFQLLFFIKTGAEKTGCPLSLHKSKRSGPERGAACSEMKARFIQYAAADSSGMKFSRHFYHSELYCIDLAQVYAICSASFKTSLIIYANPKETAVLHWINLNFSIREDVRLLEVVSLSLCKFICIIRAKQ